MSSVERTAQGSVADDDTAMQPMLQRFHLGKGSDSKQGPEETWFRKCDGSTSGRQADETVARRTYAIRASK